MDSNGDGIFEQKITMGSTFIYVPATIDIDPNTLNLKSKGQWLTCYIELPKGYDVKKIITNSICLCEEDSQIFAEAKPFQIGDYDKDGISDLMVKFDKGSLIELLKNTGHISGSVTLAINGQIENEIWGGINTIGIIGRLTSLDKPEEFALLQNFPNSFNPETWIPYQLAEEVDVAIRIYNASGQLVRTLNLGYKQAGFYTNKDKAAYWDGRNELGEQVASGVYFYQIKAGDFVSTKKFVMLK